MKLDVNEETLQAANQCRNHCICQSVGGKPYCQITETINNSVFFTARRNPMGCPYQHSFGSSFMCTCPVRQEIYRRYRV